VGGRLAVAAAHRLDGVDGQVEEDLLQLGPVEIHFRQRVGTSTLTWIWLVLRAYD
jgi:hypothetical protein